MDSTFKDYANFRDHICDKYGQDEALIIDGLLITSLGVDQEWTVLSKQRPGSISDFEYFLISNIGVPKWMAPNLNIVLDYAFEEFVFAEIESGSFIVIDDYGRLVWKKDGESMILASTLSSFIRMLIWLSTIIFQCRVSMGSDYFSEHGLPSHCMAYFMELVDLKEGERKLNWVRLMK